MNYRYRAMTQDGQKLQGIIDANDERQARLRLREEGLFLLDIRPQKSSGVKTRRPRISHSELTLFTRQLATLSAAALPLEESLAVIGQQSSNKRLADVLNQVRSAFPMHYSIFPRFSIRSTVPWLKRAKRAGCWPRCWKNWLITMKIGRKSAANSFSR